MGVWGWGERWLGKRERGRGEGGQKGESGCILVEFPSLSALVADIVAQGDHPRDEGDAQEGIQGAVKHIPETNVIPSHLPEFGALVRDETKGHEIQYPLHYIQIPRRIDRINRRREQHQIQKREEDLDGVLVKGRTHPIRVEMVPEIRVGFSRPGDEVGGGGVVLDEPAAPEVGDAFLVARGADDAEGVEVDGAFDCVGRFGGFGGDEDGVAF